MLTEAITINYQGVSGISAGYRGVSLEQVIPASARRKASVQDVYQSWWAAVYGQSSWATRWEACPAEIQGSIVRFFLGFYAWPQPRNLHYRLETNIGTLGPKRLVAAQRSWSAWLANSRETILPYAMSGVSVIWETPCYSRYGERIARPGWVQTDNKIIFDYEVFGGVRISGTAHGHHYVLTVEIDKANPPEPPAPEGPSDPLFEYVGVLTAPPENGQNRITGIKPIISVYWDDGEDGMGGATGSSLDLAVPECVTELLDYCPTGFQHIINVCKGEDAQYDILVNGCTGEVIDVRERKGTDDRMCSPISGTRIEVSGWVYGFFDTGATWNP
jgi:hypothetical protein